MATEEDPALALNRQLISASRAGDLFSCVGAVVAGADTRHQEQDYTGYTALHWAAARGHASLVTALLDHGIEVDLR